MNESVECKHCGLLYAKAHEKDCAFKYEFKCPFGCDTIGFSSEQLKSHRVEKYYFHLDMLYSLLKSYGLNKKLEIEDSNSSSIENQVNKALGPELIEIQKLIDKGTYLQKKLFLKKNERREQMKLLEKAIDDTSLTSFNGILVWIIPEAMSEMKTYCSPVFYTGKYGYKLRLQIEQDKIHNENSIKLIFLKGMYDPVLQERFSTTLDITFQIGTKEKKSIKNLTVNLSRINTEDKATEKEIPITNIESGPLSMIRFKMDCSQLEMSSVD